MNREIVKTVLNIEHDRFKVGISLIVVVSSGLVGLILKKTTDLSDYVLALGGAIADTLLVFYTVKTYIKVNNLIRKLEDSNG